MSVVMLEELTRTVADLQNDMVSLQKEFRSSIGSVNSVKRITTVLDDASRKSTDQLAALEDRIASIEHNQETSGRSITHSLESFSTRLTELGEELVAWPPAPDVRSALERFEQVSSNCDSVARQTHQLHSLLEQCRFEIETKLKQHQLDFKAVVDLSCKHGQENRGDVDGVKYGLDEHREIYKRDIAGIKLMLENRGQHGHQDVDELRCIFDEVRQQGRESQRDIDGLKAAVHQLQYGTDYAVHDCPRNWTESQLSSWLVSQGLPADVAHTFQAHLVNGLVGVELTKEDLISMGIADPFQQRRIMRELQKLFRSGQVIAAVPARMPASANQPAAPSRPQSARSHRPQSARSYASTKSSNSMVPGKRSRPPSATSRAPCFTCQDLACTALASGFSTTMKNAAIVPRCSPMDSATAMATPGQRQPQVPLTARGVSTPLRSPQTCGHDGSSEPRSLRDAHARDLGGAELALSQASGDTLNQLEALRRRCEEREQPTAPLVNPATDQLFDLMDSNRDGVITRSEFTQSLATAGGGGRDTH